MNCAKCMAPGICVCGEAYSTQEFIRHAAALGDHFLAPKPHTPECPQNDKPQKACTCHARVRTIVGAMKRGLERKADRPIYLTQRDARRLVAFVEETLA